MGIIEGTHHAHKAEIVKSKSQRTQIIMCLKKTKELLNSWKVAESAMETKANLIVAPKQSRKSFPAGGRALVGSLRMGRRERGSSRWGELTAEQSAQAERWKQEDAASSYLRIRSQSEV